MNTNDLDKTLKQWAEAKAPSDEHVDALSRKIITQAVEHRQRAHQPRHTISFAAALQCVLAGAAAMLVACIVYVHMTGPPGDDSGAISPTSFARVTASDVNAVRNLYDETELLFADRLKWMSDSGGELAMGIDSSVEQMPRTCKPMLVRMTIVSRPIGDEAWEPLWRTDVLMHGQEVAEVTPNPDTKNTLSLWVYELEDGNVAVDTRFSLNLPDQLASCVNAVVTPGEPTTITTVVGEDREYRVLQTVVPLGAEG